VVVSDMSPDAVAAIAREGALGAVDARDLVARLTPPRAVWLMLPAAVTDRVLDDYAAILDPGDILIDGGNSDHRHDAPRGERLAAKGIGYVDVGVSGGVWGLERGYCMMVGGRDEDVDHLVPVLDALAPGVGSAPRTPGREGPPAAEEQGWLHCGGHGAGHFVKMVHNGIEYGLMAAYAEGLNLLHGQARAAAGPDDAETAPRDPDAPDYPVDVAAVAEVWRRGSVISSWLLDLTAASLVGDPDLAGYEGRVSDSGEGRWTVISAVQSGVPAPVLATALFSRFTSRGAAGFGDRVLSAMRHGFGGHDERPPEHSGAG
jgi:6-phosphogluconate dehydrogenase